MKHLLATLLTLTLLAGALVATHAQACDPATDPTCTQQCPRDIGGCTCTWEPWCDNDPPPDENPPHKTPRPPKHDEVNEHHFALPARWIEIFNDLY